VQQCQRAEVLFVYTHVVPYFKKWIAPRLHKPFILISHNSDNEVSIEDLDLLNHPQLIAWFAQNVKFNHSKLKALPIGLPNNEWHSEHSALIYNSTRAHRKTKSIYINLSNCSHADAKAICDAITGLPQTVQSNEIPYEQYIAKMAEHRFCLCPRGNSIDTYRFWEAQYVDCIPVILKEDWTQAYSNLPVLLLDSWAQLKAVNLDRKYIEISTKSYGRSSLTMHFYQKEIESLKAAIKFSSTDI